MPRRPALKIDKAKTLRLFLHVHSTPSSPLLTHISRTYPELLPTKSTTSHIPTLTSSPITKLVLTSNLPFEQLALYRNTFATICQHQRPFDLVWNKFEKKVGATGKSASLLVKAERKPGDVLGALREVSWGEFEGKEGLIGRYMEISYKFRPKFGLLRGVERERTDKILVELNEEYGIGEGEEVEENDGRKGVLTTKVVGLSVGARYPDQFPEWKEDFFWGFNENVEGQTIVEALEQRRQEKKAQRTKVEEDREGLTNWEFNRIKREEKKAQKVKEKEDRKALTIEEARWIEREDKRKAREERRLEKMRLQDEGDWERKAERYKMNIGGPFNLDLLKRLSRYDRNHRR